MEANREPAERQPSGILKRGMTPTHELMGEWILQNPGGTLKEMGDHFNYSVPWLSQVLNTDMFKAYMAKRMTGIQAVVTQDVPTKMGVLASIACDKMLEALLKSGDPEFVRDSFDKVMHRYGYAPNAKNGMQPQGPAGAGPNIHGSNVFFLSQEQFSKVQGRLIESHSQQPHDSSAVPQLEQAKEDDGHSASANTEKV